ncbi:hypothetical protein ACIA8O_19085 [Kitasatospora sp. NPDC051853]|uniref:hypothetical protein n=1 Tax=Kitasatospora sp. NPDC051853 TaxID=3364058 RepID=UPI00379781F8
MRASPYRALLALVALVLATLTCSAAGPSAHTHLAAPAGVLTVFELESQDPCPGGATPAPTVADHCAEESAQLLAAPAPLLPALALVALLAVAVLLSAPALPGRAARTRNRRARPRHGRTLLNQLCLQRV